MNIVQDVQNALQTAFPTSTVVVEDPMQDGAHLSATIISEDFSGKTRIARHRLVYKALGNAFESKLHALQLTTKAPEELK